MNVIVEREKSLEALEQRIEDLRARSARHGTESSDDMRALEQRYAELQRDMFGRLSPWERVNMARHPRRPVASDYIARLDQFDELHGDRQFRDDPAFIGGLAKLSGRRIMVLAQQKGHDTKENIRRNFGMVTPEGYRKARRLMELAGRFSLPIVSFVDTSGADPGIGSEERAQSEAIASCLLTLARVPVPVVAAIIGEGGSGGALAIALADYVIMLQHSIYSVASPEGCAAILWADASRAEEAAAHLKLTSDDLLDFGIADEIVPEPLGGAHRDAERFVASVLAAIDSALGRLGAQSRDVVLARRHDKYRRVGAWQEGTHGLASVAVR